MDALLDHRAHSLMTYITSCLYWTHPPGHLLLMALCWMLGKFKVFQRHPLKIILRKVQRQNFLDEWKCRSFPGDKKPWQWASGWASGEDNGQNKKELSCSWNWERLTVGGRDLSLPFSRGKTDCSSSFAASPAFGHLHQSGCCSRKRMWHSEENRSPGARGRERHPASSSPAPWPWAVSPWNGVSRPVSWIYCEEEKWSRMHLLESS